MHSIAIYYAEVLTLITNQNPWYQTVSSFKSLFVTPRFGNTKCGCIFAFPFEKKRSLKYRKARWTTLLKNKFSVKFGDAKIKNFICIRFWKDVHTKTKAHVAQRHYTENKFPLKFGNAKIKNIYLHPLLKNRLHNSKASRCLTSLHRK